MLEDRDLATSKAALRDWLRGQLPADAEPEVSDIEAPEGSGFSSETLLVTARWSTDGDRADHDLVLRLASARFRVVPDIDLFAQVRVMRLLAEHSTVPVPKILWYEESPAVLGGPFLVMERLPGRAPADQPPYHEAGWMFDISPADREAIWWSAVDVLADLHNTDTSKLDLSFLHSGTGTPLQQHLDRLAAHQAWVSQANLPETTAALEWLRGNQPVDTGENVLLWGDARIGNMLFSGSAVTAALDWEKAMVGPREIDLAWFLYIDRHHSEGCRLPRLAGLPGHSETIARYEKLTGRTMRNLPYYQLLSSYQFALLMIKAIALLIEFNLMPEDTGASYVVHNSGTKLLRTCLSEVT